MLVVLIAWAALALVLGALIGKAIHHADVVQFPGRTEYASWTETSSPAAPRAAAQASADTAASDLLAA